MTDKLNQSLDDILSQNKRKNPRNLRARRVNKGTKTSGPVGGVQKNTKQTQANNKATKATASTPGSRAGFSKAQVSNLPNDVSEAHIKEYFSQSIGSVKKIEMSYDSQGRSRGSATILFNKTDSAAKAAKELNGIKVDNRHMRVEVLIGAKDITAPQEPKKLADRVNKPKNAAAAKPKPATDNKNTKTADGKKAVSAGRKGPRRARTGRAKPKTAEELDQEMADYFDANTANGDATMAGGAVQPAANGEAAMTDEIL